MYSARKAADHEDESVLLENREFSYRELKHITDNFSQEIGKGGFGPVFLGYLENGNSVAVKVLSESSSQGVKEFLAEVKRKSSLKFFSGIVQYSFVFLSSMFRPIYFGWRLSKNSFG
jgi:predicted Ser/Thr protein kinase